MKISSPVPPFQLENEELRLGPNVPSPENDTLKDQTSNVQDYSQLQKTGDEGTTVKTEEILGQWSNMIQQINELDSSDVRIVPQKVLNNSSLELGGPE